MSLEGLPVSRKGERKVVLLLLPTESSLARPQGREEEVVLPFPFKCATFEQRGQRTKRSSSASRTVTQPQAEQSDHEPGFRAPNGETIA